MANLGFVHRFEPGASQGAPVLLLLHGTGGNESDLLPLGHAIAPDAALLSPRGKVLERGMPRFFRRLSEGVFDEDDIRLRANELADFVAAARQDHGLPAPIALGYSNGANIAAAMMQLRPEAVAGAILLRAMTPFHVAPKNDLSGKAVLVISGAHDPIAPPDTAAPLVTQLREAGALVTLKSVPASHGLTDTDVLLPRQWLAAFGPRAA